MIQLLTYQKEHFFAFLALFLFSLFIIITISVPALHINDDWITLNQLHQLGIGHQVTINEGKYGTTTVTGQISSYFLARQNILGYSLFLPIISYPAWSLFSTFGDFFRLLILLIWISIPVSIFVICMKIYPELNLFYKRKFFYSIIILTFIVLFINLSLYYPFSGDIASAPLESAAIILTNSILFSLTVPMVFNSCRLLFPTSPYCFFSTFAIISCSSYIFWATDAKDHILTIFILSVILYQFIKYQKYQKDRNAFFGFIGIGFLTWARPELGFTLFFALLLYYLVHVAFFVENFQSNFKFYAKKILLPLSIILGLIPFFINNLVATGNPLYPIFLRYEMATLAPSTSQDIVNSQPVIMENLSSVYGNMPINLNILTTIGKYFTIHYETIIVNLRDIFFFPENGSIGIFGICPLFLLGIVLLIWFFFKKQQLSYHHYQISFLCLMCIAAILFAYVRSWPGLSVSEGIGPDMRYLSPLYLPAGYLGMITIHYLKIIPDSLKRVFWGIIGTTILSFLIILAFLIFQPFGGGYFVFLDLFTLLSCLLAVIFIIIAILSRTLKINNSIPYFMLLGLCSIPLSCQIMLVFLYSISKFDGYSYWIPLMEAFFTLFFIPIS